MKLDNTILVEIPEGIGLQVELAGAPVRALAFAVDISIRLFISIILASIIALAGNSLNGLYLIGLFILEWFYPVFFEVLNNGQTPGKKIYNILVVNDDLTSVSWESSIIRNLLRSVDFLPFAYLSGLVSMLVSTEFRRLGDYAAGTLVIYKNIHSTTSIPDIKAKIPSINITLSEQNALINFTQRHQHLSNARQAELANLLYDLHKTQDMDAVKELQSIGAFLLGKL